MRMNHRRYPWDSRRLRRGGAMAMAMAVLGLAGCAELGLTGPDVDLVTEETYAALDGAERAPVLPGVIDDVDPAADLSQPAEAWKESWKQGGMEGHLLRARAYERAVPVLAEAMDAEQVAEAVGRLRGVLDEAEGIEGRQLSRDARRELARARDLGSRAEAALEEGEEERVIRTLLEAGDALQALSPEAVAREMIRTAARSVEAARSPDASGSSHGGDLAEWNGADRIPSEDLERARRLARGAERAFERGEHRRAIQRAFYAHQIASNGGTR